MSAHFSYRPVPFVDLPAPIDKITPPSIPVVAMWCVFGWIALSAPTVAFTAGFLLLALITVIKYAYSIPRFYRPTVPVGVI